jgi:hypothetical protein
MIQFKDYEVSLLIHACMKMANSKDTEFASVAYQKLMHKLENYMYELETDQCVTPGH